MDNCILYFINPTEEGFIGQWDTFPKVGVMGDINSLLIKFFMKGVGECIALKEEELIRASVNGTLETEINSNFSIDFSFDKVSRMSDRTENLIFISDEENWILARGNDAEVSSNTILSIGKYSFVDLLVFEGGTLIGLIVKPANAKEFYEQCAGGMYQSFGLSISDRSDDPPHRKPRRKTQNAKSIIENFNKILEEDTGESSSSHTLEEDIAEEIEIPQRKKKSKKHRDVKRKERKWADIEDDE